jgi:phospholipase C
MECFQADQLPALTALGQLYGIVNYWYSPMPGPTWPNRFFVHAGTCGGLTESPGKLATIAGFDFKAGTIYDSLVDSGLGWRVYHGDMPQVLGIRSIRKHYVGSTHFRVLSEFQADAVAGDLPEYTFIEPRYDVFNDYRDGNSMHPLDDVAHGEQLVKDVYEAIRNSTLWKDTMLVVTFDEHGGFYDHVSPPTAPPTGDDTRYATKGRGFKFDRYGVRVPAIVVSAYTAAGTVIGKDSDSEEDIFDHCSILATIEKRFGLKPLTKRDAKANTLELLLNLDVPREQDAPGKLPAVKKPPRAAPAIRARRLGVAAARQAPLTKQQEAFLGLVVAIDAQTRVGGSRVASIAAAAPRTKSAADAYAKRVQARVLAGRARRTKT